MKNKTTTRDILRKYLNICAKANTFHIFGPKSWAPQTDYNPVSPGSGKPGEIDMRPKAVKQREKEARRSLIMPAILVAGIPVLFLVMYLIKVNLL